MAISTIVFMGEASFSGGHQKADNDETLVVNCTVDLVDIQSIQFNQFS